MTKKGNAPEVAATGASSELTQDSNQGFHGMNSTQVSTSSATPDLSIIDGKITTSSQQVAEHFGKRHTHVLRAIRNLIADLPAEHQPNFGLTFTEVAGPNGATRKDPSYRLTRDGFTLLAMGFTGKEAMHWKLAYIDAFNKMEAELLSRTTRQFDPAIDYKRISPAQAQAIHELVAAVVASGAQGYGETWKRFHNKFRVNSYLELPDSRFSEACEYLKAKVPSKAISGEQEAMLRGLTINDTVARLTQQVDSQPTELFMPLVNAVMRKQGYTFFLPSVQEAAILDRIDRLASLFHPHSKPFADVLGIVRMLRGMNAETGTAQSGYRAVIPELKTGSFKQVAPGILTRA